MACIRGGDAMLNVNLKANWLNLERALTPCVAISIMCVSALTLIAGDSLAQSNQVRRPAYQAPQSSLNTEKSVNEQRRGGLPFTTEFERLGIKLGVSTVDDVRRMIKTVGARTIGELNISPDSRERNPSNNSASVERVLATNGVAAYGIPDVDAVNFKFDEGMKVSEIIVIRRSSASNEDLFEKRLAELQNGREILQRSDGYAILKGTGLMIWLSGKGSKLEERYMNLSAQTVGLEAYLRKNHSDTAAKSNPEIAKSKAAGVDTRVFGVPLGEPLRLPDCANVQNRESSRGVDILGALQGVQTSTTCQSEGATIGLLGALVGGKPADRYILLAKNTCPYWAFCEVVATLYEGNLVGVAVLVQKGARADDVGKQLRAKYGKPTRKETAHYQNDYGARYEADNLEWILPGLHVAYTPVPLGGGSVIIETEMGQKARKAKEDTEESRQPKL